MNQNPKHPVQPLIMVDGVLRFKENKAISWVLDKGNLDLNRMHAQGFSQEDLEQVSMLVGYSLSGFGGLSHVSDETYERAEKQSSAASPQVVADERNSNEYHEFRQRGYTGEAILPNANALQVRAWCEGLLAREPKPWMPSPENINALPKPIKAYIHDITAIGDYNHIMHANTFLKDQCEGLQRELVKARAALAAASNMANAIAGMLNTLFDASTSQQRGKCINDARKALAEHRAAIAAKAAS